MVLFLCHLDKILLELQLILLSSFAKILNQGVICVVNNLFALNIELFLIFPFLSFEIFEISLKHWITDKEVNSITEFRNLYWKFRFDWCNDEFKNYKFRKLAGFKICLIRTNKLEKVLLCLTYLSVDDFVFVPKIFWVVFTYKKAFDEGRHDSRTQRQ